MPREVVHDPFGQRSGGLGVTGEAIQPSEVLDRFGVGGNAEVLIQAVREHNPAALTSAGAKRVNDRLTDQARAALAGEEDADWPGGHDVREVAGEGATVQDVAVRGTDDVVYVATDALGVSFKGTFKLDDPDGTHVSQAEVLGRQESASSQVIGPRRMARSAAIEVEQAALEARERAVAKREKALAEAEREAYERQGEAEAQKPVRPAGLPADYDTRNLAAAREAIAAISDPQLRRDAIEYERQTKGRKHILALGDEDEDSGALPGGEPSGAGRGGTEST